MSTFLVVCTVTLTYLINATVGFGGSILAISFVSSVIGFGTARPLLTCIAVLLPLYITIVERKHLNWKELKIILLWTGLGLPVGLFLYDFLPTTILLISLGCIMILASILGLIKLQGKEIAIKSKIFNYFLLFVAGIVQGSVQSGGALVPIYVALVIKDKMEFRVTLSAIWTILNLMTVVPFIFKGYITSEVLYYLIWCIPFIFIATLVGTKIAQKISTTTFSYLINIILMLGGTITIYNNL